MEYVTSLLKLFYPLLHVCLLLFFSSFCEIFSTISFNRTIELLISNSKSVSFYSFMNTQTHTLYIVILFALGRQYLFLFLKNSSFSFYNFILLLLFCRLYFKVKNFLKNIFSRAQDIVY